MEEGVPPCEFFVEVVDFSEEEGCVYECDGDEFDFEWDFCGEFFS